MKYPITPLPLHKPSKPSRPAFIRRSFCSLSLVAAFTVSTAHPQVLLTPNEIEGTLEFSNTNPDVLTILNTALPMRQLSLEAISIGLPSPLQAFGGSNIPDSPTHFTYQFSVQTSSEGISYQVSPRYVRLSAFDGVLGSQTYTFKSKTSAPVFPKPADPVPLDFSECVAILDIQWVDQSGNPITISGGRMDTVREYPPGSDTFNYSDNSGLTGVLLPAGISQRYHAVRGGEKWKLFVSTEVGLDPFSDRVRFGSEIVIEPLCDTITPLRITVPTGTGVGRITGRVDLVGEDEHDIPPLIFADGQAGHGLTRVGADEGPFSNSRYDYLNFSPSEGIFELENLIASDAVSPALPYTVFADFAFRTGNRYGRLQTPFLRGNYAYNQGVFVPAGATIDLGDTLVIRPGFVSGRLRLAGESLKDIYLPGNFTDANEVPLQFNLIHGFGFNWRSQGGADAITPGSVLWAEGFESSTPVPGATTHSWFGQGVTLFPGAYNPTTDAFEGDYEIVLGGLNSDPTKWLVNHLWLRFLNTATPSIPESYRDGHVIITDNRNAVQTIFPGQTLTVDRSYCFNTVRVHFRSTSGTIFSPAIIYSGGFSGTDFQNQPADYNVLYGSQYSYAVGTPRDQNQAQPEALVVFALPQGTYRLEPQARLLDTSGNVSILSLASFEITANCRQVIDLTPQLQLSLNTLPACATQPNVSIAGTVNSDVAVTRVFYSLNGGPEHDICNACGIDPILDFTVLLVNGENQLNVTAIDSSGNEASVTSTMPSPFTVINTADSGCGSLRQAILNANASPGLDLIDFKIPGAGPHTIQPLSALPTITDPVVIDGYTQPGASPNSNPFDKGINAVLKIELDGTEAAFVDGLVITAGNSIVRGLVINRFLQSGIVLSLNGGNTIEGNFVGSDTTGMTPLPQRVTGIRVFSAGNLIGGISPAARNLGGGISLEGSLSSANRVQGNYLGTTAAGDSPLGNSGVVISGFDNIVGGSDVNERNLLSGNDYGVFIASGAAGGNRVLGNFIGIDCTGKFALPNLGGVRIDSGVANRIGGSGPGEGNVIAGNLVGVGLRLPGTTGNIVEGNWIGTDVGALAALGNTAAAVYISDGALNNMIQRNEIAFNGQGVQVVGDSTVGNSIRANAIYSNGSPGIDLGGDGVTANDSADVDTGPNQLQNFPVLTSAVVTATGASVSGTLNSKPNTLFIIELFANGSCNAREGRAFVDWFTVATDATGNASFAATISSPMLLGTLVTATATDPEGNTSEFSSCSPFVSANSPPHITSLSGSGPLAVGNSATVSVSFTDPDADQPHTCTFSWGDGSPATITTAPGTGSGSRTATHVYATTGVYTVTVTVSDSVGATDTAIYQFIVIYDPNGGFVTGGGWINSPAGGLIANPSLTGRANFGFVSKYQNGATVPNGDTEFQFKAGDLNFKSTSYDWLVVAGAKAKYKGSGKINGSGDYGFQLTATDGQISGGGGVDRFRIKIWHKLGGGIIYDNQPGDPDTADATTALAGGSVVIHK
jgi:hypothetical protein